MVGRLWSGVLLIDPGWSLTVECLEAPEPGLHILPPKRIVVHNPGPLFIVIAGAYGINAKINSGRAAQASSSRVVKLPVVAMFLGGSLIPPVHVLVLKSQPPLAVHEKVSVIVEASSFEKKNFGLLCRACEARGYCAARGAAYN